MGKKSSAAVNTPAIEATPPSPKRNVEQKKPESPPKPLQPAPSAAALSQTEIMQKLNSVPTFCILNGDSNIVGMQDPEGEGEVCCWFTDADDAMGMLASARESNPDVPLLHLGVTPLGLALGHPAPSSTPAQSPSATITRSAPPPSPSRVTIRHC
jgi:hypothetical protein